MARAQRARIREILNDRGDIGPYRTQIAIGYGCLWDRAIGYSIAGSHAGCVRDRCVAEHNPCYFDNSEDQSEKGNNDDSEFDQRLTARIA